MSAMNCFSPAAGLDVAPGNEEKVATGMAKKKKARIVLLVDEDQPERDRVRSILEEHGYKVLEASDYGSAIQTHTEHAGDVDLLLTAIALPGNNGYELASALSAGDPALRVLFASGPTGAEVSRFYNMPVTGPHLLKKPIEAAELTDRVKRVLRSRTGHLHVERAS